MHTRSRARGGLVVLGSIVLAGGLSAQTITEFALPTAGAGPTGVSSGDDGRVWFTEQTAERIGSINPDGTIREITLSTGAAPAGITTGFGGRVWFTEFGANKIGRVNFDGSITEFPIPTAGANPQRIAFGPDGNFWFTEFGANKIGRITPSGDIDEFDIPTATAWPLGIAAGPDGNVWFAEFAANKIGWITPAGAIMEIPVPTPSGSPWEITTGPDGRVWFTEYAAAKLGRVNADHSISEFPLANPAAFPQGIASYDGSVWFVENVSSQVGRVNGDGSISEFPIPTGASQATGLAPGPDGNLWFTEFAEGANGLGRLSAIVDYQLTEFASPTEIISGPDGGLWFGEPGLDAAGRFGVDGSYEEFPVAHFSIFNSVVVGPDAHIWFTGYYGNDVSNIPTSGDPLTSYPVPTDEARPYGIAAGSDGNLWFAEFFGDKIGRLNPSSGAIDEFPLTIPGALPSAMTAGPDGNLWFTEVAAVGNAIGRCTTSGAITEFALPTAGANPQRITVGPDGNLWFTEYGLGRIGVITPTGTIHEVPLPMADVQPLGITAGPDGNLWFTEDRGNRVGRMTTAGSVTEFPVPTPNASPAGITTGADGALWFSEFIPDKIGRIVPPGTTLTPNSGPSAGGAAITVAGFGFTDGATIAIGGVAAANVALISPTRLTATTPAVPAGTLDDLRVTRPDGSYSVGPAAWFSDFSDVFQADAFHDFVEKIFRRGITAGCGNGRYCRDDSITRAQMAVFLLKSEHGARFYTPPACTGVFPDVPCPATPQFPYSDWIEELSLEGVTAGCGNGNFCPDQPVTRAEMAVFLLKTEHGTDYSPPACRSIFSDVVCPATPEFPYSDWIEQLASEGVTGGCATDPPRYCPDAPVTRGQMAVFLTKTFLFP